jgi:signal transduction histidine kinase
VGERVALETLAAECLTSARESLRWGGETELAGRAVAWCDPRHLRQVLLNLLLNGMQAAGPDGRVRVAIAAEPAPVLRVEDDGPGIPVEQREQIFEPFYTTRSQGAGLGLAVVKRLAELGRIGLTVGESDAGGARFELRFQRHAEESA